MGGAGGVGERTILGWVRGGIGGPCEVRGEAGWRDEALDFGLN